MNRRPRVLSHPPRHPYVDRFDDTVSRVVHRDEPMPRLDAYHDPDWVRRQRGDWDLVHLHFGHEHHPVERMVDVLDAHRSAGTPIVVTVHDLANPHLRPQDDPSLDLLGPMVGMSAGGACYTQFASPLVAHLRRAASRARDALNA